MGRKADFTNSSSIGGGCFLAAKYGKIKKTLEAQMKNLKIEFFHDVICSFCYPMSHRMRKVQAEYPELKIIHRSFALARTDADLIRMFGSLENAKAEILHHWHAANQNDDLHRFNITGMRDAHFPFPASLKPLAACKAAYIIGGDDAYWDMFDACQNAFFSRNLDIGKDDVLKSLADSVLPNAEEWQKHFVSDKVAGLVDQDLAIAATYGFSGVPAIVINEMHLISGARPLQDIINELKRIAGEG